MEAGLVSDEPACGESDTRALPPRGRSILNISRHLSSVIRSHMNMGDLYVFDWFETSAAAAALGSKICTEIFVISLQPSILQRSPWFFAHTYLGWSRSAVWNLGPNAQTSRNGGHNTLKTTLLHFSPSLFWLLLRNLVGTYVRGKGHIVCEFYLKRPWPWEMAAILRG